MSNLRYFRKHFSLLMYKSYVTIYVLVFCSHIMSLNTMKFVTFGDKIVDFF